MKKPEGVPLVLTVDEAAVLLRIDRKSLYTAIRQGEIPVRRIGRSIRISREALMRWLAEGRAEEKPLPVE